jgi:superfamily II DNA or RNA helicase
MELRDYQERFVENIARSLVQHKKIIAQLATGGGKTVTFSAISKRYIEKSGQKVLILVHRIELLNQAAATIQKNTGIKAVPIIAGIKNIPDAEIYVGMVETISRRFDKLPDFGLIIIDEAHIGNFKKIINHYNDKYIIGFTATPLNATKKEPLKDYFKGIVCGIDIPDLIINNYLCRAVTRVSDDKIDTDKFKILRGDYDVNEMAQEYSNEKYISSTVKMYEKHALNHKTLIFNCNVEHSKLVTDAFISAGYDCRHLDGETQNRDEILKWFAETPNAILSNVFITTTGFDQPDVTTIIVNKSTLSLPLWLQMCGRGSRPTKNKSIFQIIDLGGNTIHHGEWQQSRDWHKIFFDPEKHKEGIAPTKECPKCGGHNYMRTLICDCPIFKTDNQLNLFLNEELNAQETEICGYVFPVKPIEEKIVEELKTYASVIDVETLIEEAQNRGHKDYAVVHKIIDKIISKIKIIDDQIYYEALDQVIKLCQKWAVLKKIKMNKGQTLTKFTENYIKSNFEKQINSKFPTWIES